MCTSSAKITMCVSSFKFVQIYTFDIITSIHTYMHSWMVQHVLNKHTYPCIKCECMRIVCVYAKCIIISIKTAQNFSYINSILSCMKIEIYVILFAHAQTHKRTQTFTCIVQNVNAHSFIYLLSINALDINDLR